MSTCTRASYRLLPPIDVTSVRRSIPSRHFCIEEFIPTIKESVVEDDVFHVVKLVAAPRSSAVRPYDTSESGKMDVACRNQ